MKKMEEWNIQYKELLSMPEQSYRLIDIRDEASMSYGMIPGAEWLPDRNNRAESGCGG